MPNSPDLTPPGLRVPRASDYAAQAIQARKIVRASQRARVALAAYFAAAAEIADAAAAMRENAPDYAAAHDAETYASEVVDDRDAIAAVTAVLEDVPAAVAFAAILDEHTLRGTVAPAERPERPQTPEDVVAPVTVAEVAEVPADAFPVTETTPAPRTEPVRP